MRATRRIASTAIFFASLAFSTAGRADGPATPALNTLTTPDSPAFNILGISPTSIQRPTTPRAVALSILNAFQSKGLTLVPNYALEVAPYWLWSHPYLTFEELAKNSFSTPFDTLTLSFGTTASGTATSLNSSTTSSATPASAVSAPTTGVPKAALGVRTTLLQGHANADALKKCLAGTQAQSDFVAAKVAPLIVAWVASHGGQPPPADQIKIWGDAVLADPSAPKPPDPVACRDVGTSKEGVVIDAAAALAFSFPTNAIDQGKLSSYAAWATASYLTTNVSVLGLGKFMQDNLDIPGAHTTSFDIGGRLIFAVTQFGFSTEGVYRIPLDSNTAKDQYRVDVAVDLELLDGYWLSVTGGHDFIDGSDWSKFFALANFKANIGEKPTVTVPAAAPAAGPAGASVLPVAAASP